jgi:hypothetical protein
MYLIVVEEQANEERMFRPIQYLPFLSPTHQVLRRILTHSTNSAATMRSLIMQIVARRLSAGSRSTQKGEERWKHPFPKVASVSFPISLLRLRPSHLLLGYNTECVWGSRLAAAPARRSLYVAFECDPENVPIFGGSSPVLDQKPCSMYNPKIQKLFFIIRAFQSHP